MALALGVDDIESLAAEIEALLAKKPPATLTDKVKTLVELFHLGRTAPRTVKTGPCKEVIEHEPDRRPPRAGRSGRKGQCPRRTSEELVRLAEGPLPAEEAEGLPAAVRVVPALEEVAPYLVGDVVPPRRRSQGQEHHAVGAVDGVRGIRAPGSMAGGRAARSSGPREAHAPPRGRRSEGRSSILPR